MNLKAEAEDAGSPTLPSPRDAPATPLSTPSTNAVSQEDFESILEEDLNTIAHFFAEGNDDQTEAEDVIWARLTSKVHNSECISYLPVFNLRFL